MAKTSIGWTDRSANPVRARDVVTGKVGWHCVKCSAGCASCYSEAINGRFGTAKPYAARSGAEVEMFLDVKPLEELRRVKAPSKVFVCDMTDLFLDAVPDEWIDTVLAYAALTPRHTFQVLTKRAERLPRYFNDPDRRSRVTEAMARIMRGAAVPWPWDGLNSFAWPLTNLWVGVSVEDQARADERIPHLLRTPASVRFLSVEPILGPVQLGLLRVAHPKHRESWPAEAVKNFWVIYGGESGPDRRTNGDEMAWLRSVADQCESAGVPLFVKQDSGPKPGTQGRIPDDLWALKQFPDPTPAAARPVPCRGGDPS